ncbi:hypothetical protein VNO77_43505 [Canavalia gladiata]|uniref:Uncharacterized protein n=1 Tax=Canavalia gladiata TaxID=3824 RepID=A0AAN9PPH6_CANGL
MALLRRIGSASTITLLLLGLVLFTSASSGGVMGGSFFDSDSESSSSESYTSDSGSERVLHNHVSSPPAEVERESHGGGSMVFLIFIFGLFLVGFCKDTNGNTVTVLKLQVAMVGGIGNSIQKDLTRIAETADTSSREGVSHLLTETIQSLDRHHGHWIAGYSSVDLKRNKEDGEKFYKQLSNEQRAKFDKETVVNLNTTEKKSTRSQSADVFSNEYSMFDVKESKEERYKIEEEELLDGFGNDEYIVITILVAAKGAHKLHNINGAEDLKNDFQKLRSLLSSKLLAGEVLWTPQNEDDTLSKRKLLEDYPQLANVMKSFLIKKKE